MRLLPITFFCITFSTSFTAQANLDGKSYLLQAESLVMVAPEKSLKIISNYMLQQHLTENEIHSLTIREKHSLTLRDIDLSAQTPINTVYAYLIAAKAYSGLQKDALAWNALKRAKYLVKTHGLKVASLELIFTEAFLHTWLNHNDVAATALLEKVLSKIEGKKGSRSQRLNTLLFETLLSKAMIAAKSSQENEVLAQFEQVRAEIEKTPNMQFTVWYHIALGKYFIQIKSYEHALSELLSAFWLASENDFGLHIAYANLNLTKLYLKQEIHNKALQHANQAAEYFKNYTFYRGLSDTQTQLGKIYHQQGKYNVALVNFFNALDIEEKLSQPVNRNEIITGIAQTYLKMERFTLAEKYLNKAIAIAKKTPFSNKKCNLYRLKGELALLTQQTDMAIVYLKNSLEWATSHADQSSSLDTLSLLSVAYEKKGDYKLALDTLRRYKQLEHEKDSSSQMQQLATFKYQHRSIERKLQLEDMQKKQIEDTKIIIEIKKINVFLLGSLLVILLVLLLRHRTVNSRTKQLIKLREKLYTHPRSGLKNLRMLNDKLSISLAKSSANFEQWYLGEIIHEPLNDKLSFAMFEVQFLKVIYLQHGYQQGLELERQLGDFLASRIADPARLYHFSDAIFVYIEPCAQTDKAPEQMADKIQLFIDEFVQNTTSNQLSTRLCIGMADYPFLPRAFASINNKKLIDILLMATSAARLACKAEGANQWVHLSAIDSTPAACFVNRPVRDACFENINKGLIKVKTSATSGINWQKVHGSDK